MTTRQTTAFDDRLKQVLLKSGTFSKKLSSKKS